MQKKTQYGQYFTPDTIADLMVGLSKIPKNGTVLDPCVGAGAFLTSLKKAGYQHVEAFEIDTALPVQQHTKYASFVSAHMTKPYDLIIGNPPYIRWKNLDISLTNELKENSLWQKYCNSLCDYLFIFILKSITLLKENGQLIFITPEYWLTTKHAQKMRDFILENGYIHEIIRFSEMPIFEKISSSIIIFTFVKTTNNKRSQKKITVTEFTGKRFERDKPLFKNQSHSFSIKQFIPGKKWLLRQNEKNKLAEFCQTTLGEISDIGNGMVSGLDKAFQWHGKKHTSFERKRLLPVIKAKDMKQYYYTKTTQYIFLQDMVDEDKIKKIYPHFFNQLQIYKEKLLQRYNYGRMISYWQWVFLRNYKLFTKPVKKIFVPCKERISHKNYVRFTLVPETVFPTQDVTAIVLHDEIKESIEYITAFLNSREVFQWIIQNGVIRGGVVEFSEAPLSEIPIRLIDFNNPAEKEIHDLITKLTQSYMLDAAIETIDTIQDKITTLLTM